jgi:hypothetical protein
MKSAKLRSLAWCSASLNRPRNSSYLNQTRYVLTTGVYRAAVAIENGQAKPMFAGQPDIWLL